jgi:ABC-type multidrug transport system fused ATPase/permease subunit
MDRIVVMRGGEIIEQGQHDELMAQGNWYRTAHQLKGGFLTSGNL